MTIKERFLIALRMRPVSVAFCSAAAAIVLLAGCWLGIRAAVDPYDCRIAPGVSIGTLDVGGMTRSEARKTLSAALEDSLYAQPLTLQLPRETLTLTPEESGVRVSVWRAVRTAYSCGREEGSPIRDVPLLPFLKVEEAFIRELLTDSASRTDTDLTQPNWELTGDRPDLGTGSFDPEFPGQCLLLTLGQPTVRMNVDQVYGEILSAYGDAIVLCAAGDFSAAPEVAPEALPDMPDAQAIAQAVYSAPVDDSLDLEAYSFVHGSYGCGVDPEHLKALLEEADYGETLAVPLIYTEPEVLGQEVYFRDLLGHCETRHTDDENRNTNLRLLCKALDGLILQPGEEFSYNGTVGERTAEKGYKPATAYSGTRIVKDIGGGVCQGSTTLYNCALLADLEILERVCHGAKVGYVQLGLDAAVNWNTKTDLRFRNNFHFPIMLKAEVSDGYVRMQILGTDEKDYYIEMHCGVGEDEHATYAVSYKYKYSKETGQLLSKELEARSTYYELS